MLRWNFQMLAQISSWSSPFLGAPALFRLWAASGVVTELYKP
jgi:hypothetical protein